MRLKDIHKYSLEITKEDFIPIGEDETLHIEDDDENIYMVSSNPINFELLAKTGGKHPSASSGEAFVIQLNEDVKNIMEGNSPFDYRRIIWVVRNGKVIIEEKGDYSLEFAKGGSRGPRGIDESLGYNHWKKTGGGFYLINEAVIKEDEFLNWINENPLEVK